MSLENIFAQHGNGLMRRLGWKQGKKFLFEYINKFLLKE